MKLQYHYRPQTKFAKVMFLHLSVSHSVHRGVCLSARWNTPRDQAPPGPDNPPGPGTPPPGAETATAADGTHPTGMYSCSNINYIILPYYFQIALYRPNLRLFGKQYWQLMVTTLGISASLGWLHFSVRRYWCQLYQRPLTLHGNNSTC